MWLPLFPMNSTLHLGFPALQQPQKDPTTENESEKSGITLIIFPLWIPSDLLSASSFYSPPYWSGVSPGLRDTENPPPGHQS